MKNIFKTLAVLLVVSMITFSCDNKNGNEPNDPTNDVSNGSTNQPTSEDKEIAINSQNLEGSWVLAGWKNTKYPDEDMSYVYGRTISLLEEGVLNMQRELWEDLIGYFDTWFYSTTSNVLVFSNSTLEFESVSFTVDSLTENKLVIMITNVYDEEEMSILTFERQ